MTSHVVNESVPPKKYFAKGWAVLCLSSLAVLVVMISQACQTKSPTFACPQNTSNATLFYDPGRLWPVSLSDTDYCNIKDQLVNNSEKILTHDDSTYLVFVNAQCNNPNRLQILDSLLRTFGDARNELYLKLLNRKLDKIANSDSVFREILIDINRATAAVYGINSSASFIACKNLADWFKDQEDYESADTFYRLCIDRIPCTEGLSDDQINHVYYYQGAVARQESEYDRAMIYFGLSRRICNKSEEDSLLASVLNEESIIYGSYFDFERSLALSDSAILLSEKYGDASQLDKAYLIKGVTYTLTRQFRESQKLLLDNLRKAKLEEYKVDLLIRIVNNCLSQGLVDSAQRYLKLINPDVKMPKVSRAYNSFVEAKVWHDKQVWGKALNAINKAIAEIDPAMINHALPFLPPESRPGVLNEMLVFFLGYKAKIFGDQFLATNDGRDLNACLSLYQYIDTYVQSNFKYSDSGDELHAIDLFHQLYFDAVALFIQIGITKGDHRLDSLIHVYNLRMQFKSLSPGYDLLSEAINVDPDLQKRIDDISHLNDFLPSIWKGDAISEENLLERFQKKQRLLDSIKSHFPLIYELYFNHEVPGIDAICNWSRTNNATIISLKVGSDGDVIALIYSDRLEYRYYPKWLNLMNNIIEDSKCIVQGEFKDGIRPKLIDSVADLVHPCTEKLILNVEKELEYVPFGAMLDINQAIYYCQSLKRMPSVKLDSAVINKSERVLSLVRSDADGADLPYTYLEGKLVEKTFGPNAKVFYAEDATLENLIRNKDQFDVIHFAMHGVYNASDPSKCGIQLADHLLSLVEIGQMDWTGKTILLNICDAGNGRATLGLGAMSVAKAFVGAKIVLAPLYEINDKFAYAAIEKLLLCHEIIEEYRTYVY